MGGGAVALVLSLALGGRGAAVGAPIVAVCAGAAVYVAAGPRRGHAVISFLGGMVLSVVVLYGALILFILTGCSEHGQGHIAGWMWEVAIVVLAAGSFWALQRPWRTWWALPVSTAVALIAVDVLAVAFTGSTGACAD
jgi:hypothetical protein